MATIRVKPLPDGVSMRGSWQVTKDGGQITHHTKKSAALRKAKKTANKGDTLVIYRVNGTIQERRTVRAGTGHSSGSSSSGSGGAGIPHGFGTVKKGVSDAFDF